MNDDSFEHSTNDKWFIQHKHIYNEWLWPIQTNKNSHMEISIHVGVIVVRTQCFV